MMRRLVAVLALTAAACGSPVGADHADVTLRDGAIDTSAAPLAAGAAGLTITNAGALPHTLVVTTRDGAMVGATDLVMPGGTVDLEVDVTAGYYLFTCRIVVQREDGSLFDHFEAGMAAPVTVTG